MTERAFNVSDADEIKRLKNLIAEYKKQLAAVRRTDPVEFWYDELGRIQTLMDPILAIKSEKRTDAQDATLEKLQAQFDAAMTRYRIAREPVRDWYDITGDVIWNACEFTQMARTGPGSFMITLKGAHPEYKGGEEIHFTIDDLRVFGGWVTTVERGYFFSDYAQPKTILRGTDFNILFDRLAVRNYPWEFAHGNRMMMGDYGMWPAFEQGTMDSVMIDKVFGTYVLPDLPMGFDYKTGVEAVATPAPVTSWVMPTSGSGLRRFMQSVGQITSAVWYIDPYMVLQYHDRMKVTAPYPLTDGLGGISSRGLSVSTDISQMMNDVLVWGTLAKNVEGEIMVSHTVGDGKWLELYWRTALEANLRYIRNLYAVPPAKRSKAQKASLAAHIERRVVYKANLAYALAHPDVDSVGTWGRWQVGEFREDIHHQSWLNLRSRAIMLRYEKPIVHASATVWDPGYQAGHVVTVKSATYGISHNLVIQSLKISFTVMKESHGGKWFALPQYDLVMGLDPEAPWNIYDYLPYPNESTPGLRGDTTGGG
jgi:hypothetical protein